MAYVQRTTEEILRSMLARMVARSTVTDITEGSVLYDLFASMAEQLADTDYRINKVRSQFDINNATGTDLDERAGEIGLTRLQPSKSTGTVTFTRSSTTGSLTIPKGSIVQSTLLTKPLFYTSQDVSFANGQATVNASVQCGVSGSLGNVAKNAIATLVNVPDGVIAVSNGLAFTNGQDLEQDATFLNRCRLYLKSLAKCQPSSIEAFARSFSASDGTRATNAHIYEGLTPGYSELLIDDGSGLYNTVSTTSTSTSFTVTGLQNPLIMPISKPITEASILVLTRTRGSFVIPSTKYTVLHERGVILFNDRTDLTDGDIVTTNTYSIYEGLISELQDQIEGDVKDPLNYPGYRAAGTRIRVLPAPITNVSLDLQITAYTGTDLVQLQSDLSTLATSFINSLDAGQPLFIAQYIDALMTDSRLENVKILSAGTNNLSPDIYPVTDRHILKAQTIDIYVSVRR